MVCLRKEERENEKCARYESIVLLPVYTQANTCHRALHNRVARYMPNSHLTGSAISRNVERIRLDGKCSLEMKT